MNAENVEFKMQKIKDSAYLYGGSPPSCSRPFVVADVDAIGTNPTREYEVCFGFHQCGFPILETGIDILLS
jgi:hypothetical protein